MGRVVEHGGLVDSSRQGLLLALFDAFSFHF